MKPLAVMPTYMADSNDFELTKMALDSLYKYAGGELDILVSDDCSPEADFYTAMEGACPYAEFVRSDENQGFARTVNVGLERARDEGRHAILINADIEFFEGGWVEMMVNQKRADKPDEFASIVGGLLMYPNGLIQHAGVYFSLLHRYFDHIYRYGPHDLPEAQKPRVCPVTAALMFIRDECLQSVGLYDPVFRMGHEDVDYCVRVWQSGRQCIYQPGIKAIHHESVFRGRPNPKVQRWTAESWHYFCQKHASVSFAEFVPSVF